MGAVSTFHLDLGIFTQIWGSSLTNREYHECSSCTASYRENSSEMFVFCERCSAASFSNVNLSRLADRRKGNLHGAVQCDCMKLSTASELAQLVFDARTLQRVWKELDRLSYWLY